MAPTLAADRVGAGALSSLECCQPDPEPMPSFLLLMNKIHAIVGDRVTYVADFPGGYPGAVYFVADLSPAPVPIDLYTMVFTAQQRAAYIATFRSSCPASCPGADHDEPRWPGDALFPAEVSVGQESHTDLRRRAVLRAAGKLTGATRGALTMRWRPAAALMSPTGYSWPATG